MRSELIPLITYIIITTFTPGSNNISSAAGSASAIFGVLDHSRISYLTHF
ncbi:MAG: hypothetical protein WA234_07015 [Rectinemataceae bacterium]